MTKRFEAAGVRNEGNDPRLSKALKCEIELKLKTGSP